MLCRRASTAAAAEIQNAAMRLTGKAKGQMGGLFKAIAISARGMQPPGFAGKAGQ